MFFFLTIISSSINSSDHSDKVLRVFWVWMLTLMIRPLRPPEVTLICHLLEFYRCEKYHLKHRCLWLFSSIFQFEMFLCCFMICFFLKCKIIYIYIYTHIWIYHVFSCQCLRESGDVRWPYFFLTDTWMWLSSVRSFIFNYLFAHFLSFHCLYCLYSTAFKALWMTSCLNAAL